jgi:tetratricopeptide (TPR) repeat protein
MLADRARVLYFFLDERDAGWALIHDILARDPLQSKAAPMQAFFYADAGDLDRAIQIVTDHLETFPNDSFALELRAQFYLEQGDLNAARQDARRVVVLAPDTVEAYRVLAIAAWDEERLAEARNHAQKMLENDPESLEAYRLLGLLALNSGDPETAVATFDEALATIPDNDLLHFYRGIAYAESGGREQAENDLTRALELSENLDLIVDIERALVESDGLPDIQDGKYVITNQEYGFTIAYTDPWIQQTPEPGSPIDVLLVYDTVDYYAQANVVALDGLEAGLTPRDFFNLFSAELRSMTGLTSLATRNIQIGDVTAYLHDYELIISSDLVVLGRQYIFVSGNRAAIVTFETFSEYFTAMLPEFEEIIATFVLFP